MATSSILLPPHCWRPGDNTTDNIAPARIVLKGSQTGADAFYDAWSFDGAGSVPEGIFTQFVMPANYSSGGALKIVGTINSTTTNSAIMQISTSAVTAGDADTPLEHAFTASVTITMQANGTEARRLITGSNTGLNMDSVVAGDLFLIRLFRDPAHASDSHTSDFEFLGAEFSYTST